MKKVLIITGPAGDAQGWGDMAVTQTMCHVLNAGDKKPDIAFVETNEDFYRGIGKQSFDIIWSALYYINDHKDIIGVNEDDPWLADIFDERGLPYIGPNALTMKRLIQKDKSHEIMKKKGVAVPGFYLIPPGGAVPEIDYPAFVKPGWESRSVGISDDSVVNSAEELEKRVAFIHKRFQQPALVEDYLPGEEYTVLMLGSGEDQAFLPATVKVDEALYNKYPILRSDLRGVGVTRLCRPESRIQEAVDLGRGAVTALHCLDHVRVDMRVSGQNRLKVIEVNGIPGMKPVKSWSPQLYTLYHGSPQGEQEDYRRLVHRIVESGLFRYGL